MLDGKGDFHNEKTKIAFNNKVEPGTNKYNCMDESQKHYAGTSLVAQWLRIHLVGASLVAQWLRICLLMQGTRVRALVWEDPTCHGAAGPVCHNC